MAVGLGSCADSGDQAVSDSADADTLKVAVVDPPREQRVMSDFEKMDLMAEGLPLSIQLPDDVVVKDLEGNTGWILMNESGDFRLIVEGGRFDMEQVVQYWKNNPEGYEFRDMLIETPQAILFEVARNGLIEYQVDAVFQGAEFLRIYSAKDRPFSRYQAERMFHACRTIQPLDESVGQ